MEYIVQNITTSLTTEVTISDNRLSYNTLTLVNSNLGGLPINVTLYLESRVDPGERFYILTATQIPGTTSLELGSGDLSYLNTSRRLMVTSSSASGDLTIFIRA